MKPTIYAIALLAAVLSLMWLEASNRRSAAPPPPPVKVTRQMFNAIRPGMTLEEVEGIVGAKPTFLEQSQTGRRIATAKWQDRDLRCIYVYCADGKVTTAGNTFTP